MIHQYDVTNLLKKAGWLSLAFMYVFNGDNVGNNVNDPSPMCSYLFN